MGSGFDNFHIEDHALADLVVLTRKENLGPKDPRLKLCHLDFRSDS